LRLLHRALAGAVLIRTVCCPYHDSTRAAQNWIDWTQAELAKHAIIGLSTVKAYESGKAKATVNNADAIRRALEDAGITFSETTISGPITVIDT
jgi:ribosome-binding protein aMBF1 (putative translation factor)